MINDLTEPPGTKPDTFLDFPFQPDLDDLDADIAYTRNHFDWDLGGHLRFSTCQ